MTLQLATAERTLGTFAMALACSACLDLPPIQYETEEAIIGTDFDHLLCQGDLDRIDRHIAFVEDMLGAASDEKIEIYIYASSPPRCPGPEGNSCYDTRRKIIRTHWSVLEHEIVHAVVDRFAEPPPFWNEGIAVALDGNGTHHGTATVMQSIHVDDATDLDCIFRSTWAGGPTDLGRRTGGSGQGERSDHHRCRGVEVQLLVESPFRWRPDGPWRLST